MFNYLLDELPTEILGCPIRTGHRDILALMERIEDIKEPREKALALLQGLFVKEIPNEETLFEKHINPFLEGGKYHRYKEEGKQTLSWYQDSQEIFSSFYQTYNIDLTKVNLHWYVFCALFAGLPAETPIKKLMELRGWKPSKNDSKEYREEMRIRQTKARILPKEKLHG
jgi:hypothetical protein